ncbi:MAG: SEC-C metal-binding domain-containing protein, partial [Gammaproteobacteria bacterium]|nr:SEC-C metal-binding domain-containing protein [Gammaproteobacteria bacterium]
YLSLEDNLMRIFASDRVGSIMQKLGMQEGEAIEHPWVSKAIENAQRKVEGRNFDLRKQLLEYDDVANEQRKVIYQERNDLMDVDDISETIVAIREDVISGVIDPYIPPGSLDEQWRIHALEEALEHQYGEKLTIQAWLDADEELYEEPLRARIIQHYVDAYKAKEEQVGSQEMRNFEKGVMLQVLDNLWKEHLAAMDYLRQGIHLRGYAQKNPKQEYKRESFELFERLLNRIKEEVVTILTRVQIAVHEDMERMEQQHQRQQQRDMQFSHPQADDFLGEGPGPAAQQQAGDNQAPYVRDGRKIGRNEPCPCGSGKKFKQCHGKIA